jgi:hypothetical protein
MPRHAALFATLLILFFKTNGYAQTPTASPERTIWDHNGSVMYLVANGSSRQFYYEKPRPGMLEAGARPGSVLFRGQVKDDQYSGTAYIFNPQCGQIPFQVKGAILDNGERIALTGQAPRVGRRCRTYASETSELEFRLVKSAVAEVQHADNQDTVSALPSTDSTTLSPSIAQTAAAHDSSPPPPNQPSDIAPESPVTPAPDQPPKKEPVWGNNLDNYVLTGSVTVLVGALLFFFLSQFYRKLRWRDGGLY